MKERRYPTKTSVINRLKERFANNEEVNPETLKNDEPDLYNSMLKLFDRSEEAYSRANIPFNIAYKRQQKQKDGWSEGDLIIYWWGLYSKDPKNMHSKFIQREHPHFFKGIRKYLEDNFGIYKLQYRYFIENIIGISYDSVKKRNSNSENEISKKLLASKEEKIQEEEVVIQEQNAHEEIYKGNERVPTFPSESHLRDFISKNLDLISINGNKLSIYSDEFGNSGIEFRTEVGVIDILANDENGNYYIIELKLTKGNDVVIGQISRYMGWIKNKLADPQKKIVTGIIIAHEIDEKLKFASSLVPNISVMEFDIQINLSKIELS